MGHPEIDNRTPFQFAPLFVADENGRPVVATIVKATLVVTERGEVRLAEEQEAVEFAGKPNGEPGKTSMRREPEVAFVKPGTDCILEGHAVARRPVVEMDVGFRVGPVQKVVHVTGDRVWDPGLLGAAMSAPHPFERLPLLWERAFGGWDRSPEKEEQHEFEPRNPVGRGFLAKRGKLAAGAFLPNLEDPKQLITKPSARPTPAGFGFVGYDWQPRAKFAGTFDKKWEETRSPLLPTDFDRRFFQAAAEGLSTPTPLLGNEPVVIIGATLEGCWEFLLPGIGAPRCSVTTRHGPVEELQTHLDTVIVDADMRQLILLWRAFTTLRQGPHDVRAIRITATNIPPAMTQPAPAMPTQSAS